MNIIEIINQEVQNNPNLVEIGVYRIDGRRHGFLYDKRKDKVIIIEESKDLIEENNHPEYSKNEYDLTELGLKELFNDLLD